jgi:hypothetical protein
MPSYAVGPERWIVRFWPRKIYRVCVSSSSSFSPNEIRAAAETHRELGPDYGDAVVDSFLDKVSREIDARVDARLAAARPVPQQPERTPRRQFSEVAMVGLTMGLGIPLSAIAVAAGTHPAGLAGLLVIWIAIAVINIAYATRRPGR